MDNKQVNPVKVKQPVQAVAQQPAQAAQIPSFPKGGFLIRYLAFIVDALILTIPPLLFLYLVDLTNKGIKEMIVITLWHLVLFVILSGFYMIVYKSVTTTYLGGTLAKLIAGLEVVDQNGKRLTLKRSLFRHSVGYMVSGLFFGLGFYWVIKDKNKQGWHDQVSGSYVVSKRKGGYITSIISLIILSVSICFLTATIVVNLASNIVLRADIEKIIIFIEQQVPKDPESVFNNIPTDTLEKELLQLEETDYTNFPTL